MRSAVAERGAHAAAPLGLLGYDSLRAALRRKARVDLDRIAGSLHGPATVVLTARGPLLRNEPSHLDRVASALARLHSGRVWRNIDLNRRDGFLAIRRRGALLARVGLVDGVLVAGKASPHALIALARRPAPRVHTARGGMSFTVPAHDVARIPGLPAAPVRGWARGTPEAVDVVASFPLG
jgi:hypothetical protein